MISRKRTPSLHKMITVIGLSTTCLTGCAAAVDQVFPTPAPTRPATITPVPVVVTDPTVTLLQVAIQPFGSPDPNASPIPPTINAAAFSASSTPLISVFATSFLPTSTTIPVALGEARIEYFSADVQDAAPGDVVTVFWSASGSDSAIIYRIDAEGVALRQWNVGSRGSLQVRTREDESGSLILQLVIGADDNQVEQQITVNFRCGGGWFINPAPAGCPNAPIYGSVFAYQRFERGRMLWIAQQSRIYILYEDGDEPGWEVYPDEWKEGMPESDPAFAPPEGLLQPVRGFGMVWRSNPAVRDRLGFGIEGETSYTSDYQGDPVVASGQMALRLVDGTIIVLDGTSRAWRISDAVLVSPITESTPDVSTPTS